jgi:hypothetical protein
MSKKNGSSVSPAKNEMPLAAAPQGIYMVTSGTHANGGCCFDYGNAERNNLDNGTANGMHFTNHPHPSTRSDFHSVSRM